MQLTGDLQVWSLGGSDFLGDFNDATLTIEEDEVDSSSIARWGESAQGVKLSGTIGFGLTNTTVMPERVTHLNVSAWALGSLAGLADLVSCTFNGSYTQVMRAGVGEWWKKPVNVKKDYSATITVDAPDTLDGDLLIAQCSSTSSNRNADLDFTINGVRTTVQMRLQRAVRRFTKDDLSRYEISLKGRDPGTGAYPTRPAGTTTLLEKAFNDFRTALAYTFTTNTAGKGITVSGNMIYNSFNFGIADGEMLVNNYEFSTYGAVGVVKV